ncbi:hypothetical protein Sfulv_25210 [Streptomyces fulvorobeus]|uniref:Uncharacterized protein n=1 Tax=Streptomyces fulvorobeus TaxID=284028 RepID=A0A7J0C5G3_9ACTN|nr:hypothetical protein Sfulv_25210 [Streptomyces fulvorobeus]
MDAVPVEQLEQQVRVAGHGVRGRQDGAEVVPVVDLTDDQYGDVGLPCERLLGEVAGAWTSVAVTVCVRRRSRKLVLVPWVAWAAPRTRSPSSWAETRNP